MWPSLPVANQIADIANFFFIGSLVVGVVATVTIVWMTGVKEAHWDEDRRGSAERIAGHSHPRRPIAEGYRRRKCSRRRCQRESA